MAKKRGGLKMNNIKKLSLILLFLAFQVAISQDILSRHLTTAAENNPGLKALYLEYQASLEKVSQEGSLPDPQVSFGYFIQPVETRIGPQQARISVSQMFPWFGTLGAKENVVAEEARVKYQLFEEAKSDLYFQVRSGFYRMYFIAKTVSITKEHLRILESLKQLVTARITGGQASAADEIQIDIEIGDLQNELIRQEELYETERVKLLNLLNASANYIIEIPDSLPEMNLAYSNEELREKMQTANPQLIKLDHLLQSYSEKEKLAAKSGLPNFSLGLDYIFVGKRDGSGMPIQDNGQDALIFPMISFNLPLYRGKYSGRSEEARYLQEATRHKKQNQLNSLESVLEEAQWEYRDANRRISLYRNQQQLARRALSIMEADYRKQNKSLEDLLQIERKIINYSLARQKALVDKNTASALIKYLMGE
jgi:outer membrane protein TolC